MAKFDIKNEIKRGRDEKSTSSDLDQRTIEHRKRLMLNEEIKLAIKTVRSALLLAFIIKSLFFSKEYLPKIVDLLVISGNYVTQAILALLIFGIIFIHKNKQ